MPAINLKQCMLVVFLFLLSCSPTNKQSQSTLGEIKFTATGKKEAQPYFEKGLLLLHSFEYEDAAEQFKKARSIDPDFTMAYWGEAMTHNHNLWRYLNFDKAIEVLHQLGNTAEEREAKAKTEIEKDFIKAVNILYSKGNLNEVYGKYADWLGQLYKKYPGNNEVAAFYSVALIGSVTEGRNDKVYEHAAQIAKEVLQRNPRHPGALHYLIHAYDDPEHAGMAISTADKYSVVAPEAGHALHMPTHIYLAIGMWDKVVSSNIDSWQASVNRKARKGLNNQALNYHSFFWLAYGYLQQGETEKAKKMVEEMRDYCAALPAPVARSYMIQLKTTYAVAVNDFTGSVSDINFKQDDLNISTRAVNYFMKGMQAFYKKDAVSLDSVIQKMTAERLIDKERAAGGIGICGNVNAEKPTMLDVQQAEVMELQLKAMQARLKNNVAGTEQYLKDAVALESSISYSYGPPSIVKPSWELYGEWLLENGRPKEALTQFELSLKAAPKRTLSVKGKEKALKLIS
jgi:pentatricopeptide repeat protein